MTTYEELTQEQLDNKEFMMKFARYNLSIIYDETPSFISDAMCINYLHEQELDGERV